MRTSRPRRRPAFSPTVDGLPSRFLLSDGGGLPPSDRGAAPPLVDPADAPLDCGNYPTNQNGSYPGDVDPWQTNLHWEHGGGLGTVNC